MPAHLLSPLSKMTIAIDFGTSNTVVAYWNPVTEQPETLALGDLSLRQGSNPPLVPSLLYVEDGAAGRVTVGQAVRDRGLDGLGDGRLFRSFKRGIAQTVQGFVPDLDGRSISFDLVGSWFLAAVASELTAAAYMGTGSATDSALILTVPVDSFEAYRHWLTGAIAESSLRDIGQVRLLDEPTAAALGYGLADRELILVIDFGGGTLDLSLVRLQPRTAQKPLGFLLRWAGQTIEPGSQANQTARVVAKAGLNLGGADLDQWLLEALLAKLGAPELAQGQGPILLRLIERLKIALSSQTEASEVYFDAANLETIDLRIDRPEFEAILRQRGLFDRLDAALAKVLQQAQQQGIQREAIGAVLLVGGSAQIPAVQAWLAGHFPADRIATDRPFEAIAHGALQLGRGLELQDFLYHGYGIRYWDRRQNRHNWQPIIRKGQTYPMTEPIELVLGASVANQPSIELIIGELGDEENRTEIFFEGDRLVTQTVGGQAHVQALNDREGARQLAKLEPPGTPGDDRIRVLFRVDQGRSLRVTVEDLLTDRLVLDDCALAQLR